MAQTQSQPLPPVQGGTAQQKAAAAKGTKPAAPGGAEAGTAALRSSEAQLRQRVEQLEEQLVDLQVVIGTLESLAKTTAGPAGPAAAPQRSGGFAPSDTNAGRIDGIEVQIKALTAQVEQLAEQVRAGDGRRAAAPPPPGRPGGAPAVAGFGSTTISGASDPVARVINGEAPPPGSSRQTVASAPVAGDAASAKQLYETAYGYLLQQNYGAAEASFVEFLQKHPGDALAGNAQYWLGESHFVRGNYKVAASAFLKGYQTYAKSAKAPDSLLKLAMSLDRLGQRDAACTSFNELNQRFPQAPTHVRTRADSERRRLGCA